MAAETGAQPGNCKTNRAAARRMDCSRVICQAGRQASSPDDLILMSESEMELREKSVKWKAGMKVKGLKMNTGKPEVMFNCSTTDSIEEKSKWPCGV